MSQSDLAMLIGRLAVHYELLSKEQVAEAMRRWRAEAPGQDLGAFMVEQGYLTAEIHVKLERAKAQYLSRQADPAAAEAETQAVDHQPSALESAASQAATAESGSNETWKLRFGPQTTLDELLRQTQAIGASDFHLHSGAPLKVRLHGALETASEVVERARAEELIYGLINDEQRELLDEERQLDFSYEIPSVGRFRANAYWQQRGLDAAFRAIPPEPPTLNDLGLPESLAELTSFHQGIVLLTGPAGCGKSSTMAALVRLINEHRPDHIITVEDPIEYVHQSDCCVVNQREVGPHTESFARALRAALREDPDVIVIGELRDLETVSLALTAAETGHLVLATLHTSNAIRTVNRILGVFPPDQQAQIRMMFSESLRAIVSQRLVPKADGTGRAAAIEILMNTKAVGNLIREQKTFQLHSIMQTGGQYGMCLLDHSLADMVKRRIISKEAAQVDAEKPESFK
ncbi:MAG: type IV pilus twitching motility protein PilT [Acidobacteriota bacterium]